jgi:tRNA (guanine26-N2/guanine27-N2)-dimethyltransferase
MLLRNLAFCAVGRSAASFRRTKLPNHLMSSHASAARDDACSINLGSAKPIPEGFSSICEGSASIIHETGHVFYNPAQVQNRDLSIACLNVFSKIYRQEKEARAAKRSSRHAVDANADIACSSVAAGVKVEDALVDYKGLRILEGPFLLQLKLHARGNSLFVTGLSASGLRSIRYAKEIPDLDFVVANDMLPAGVPNFVFLILSALIIPPQLLNPSIAICCSMTFLREK